MKRSLVIDGNSILNRAYYGIRPLSTKEGIPTNAIFGFINILNKNLDEVKPDFCAVAFDLHAPTFRHKMYDAYKAGRHATPEDLLAQFPYTKEIIKALGFTVIEKEGYEADDILGTLAALADADTETFILTGDRDSLQLINDKTTVRLASNNDTLIMNRAAFFEEYGIQPEAFVDYKALLGDASDNIPGVAGIGKEKAKKLIAQFGSIDELYEKYKDAGLPASWVKYLENGKESAYLSKTLAKICTEVPSISEIDTTVREIDRPRLVELFTKLELDKFLKKYELSASEAPQGEISPLEKSNDTNFDGDFVAISYNDGKLTVCDGKKISEITEKSDIEKVLKNHKTVCYDCKEIYKRLAADDINESIYFDVMLGAYVLDPGKSGYSLDSLVLQYLETARSENITEAQYVYSIFPEMFGEIEKNGEVGLMTDIEMPTAKVLSEMETYGFKIDPDGIKAYGEELKNTEDALTERIYYAAGEEFNINSPKQLGEVLFDKLGLPSGKKTKTGYSTNAETLERLRPYNEIIDDILDYRKYAKLRSTYVDGLLREADETGRIHTNFKQTGTATGRLSSAEPNLQNIPIKTEIGRELRRYFVPENRDYLLIDADYSQIELRILAHVSGDENMINAFLSGKDIHTSTAASVFGVPMDAVTPEMRKRAKAVNFGILYGMGDFRLSNDLHIPLKKAKEYIENYLASYPKIAEYLDRVKSEARRDGYVTTIMGRRRYIPELSAKNKNLQNFGERVAMNSPIQGSAADIIKVAMINVSEKLRGLDARLILQVHDELLIEANRNIAEKAEEILRNEMENAVKLSVPLVVDVEVGDTWFNA